MESDTGSSDRLLTPQVTPPRPGDLSANGNPKTATRHSRQLGSRLGPYILQDRLGDGGMGEVFRALHRKLRTQHAIKVMRAEFLESPDATTRFRLEAQALAKVDHHPNVVGVNASGLAAGRRYLVMDLVTGGSLRDRIRAGPLSISSALGMGLKIALALEHLHGHGVVHRDLKPENVLIGDDEEPRVGDFGLARSSDRTTAITATGESVGTPAYMCPEVAQGEACPDEQSDIFALGVMLHEMLAGAHPFVRPGLGTVAVMLRMATEAPPPLRLLRPEISTELETLVTRAMASSRRHRYSTAAQLANDLERLLGKIATGNGNGQQPPGALARGLMHARWRLERRAVVGSLAACVLLMAAGALGLVAVGINQKQTTAQTTLALQGQLRLTDSAFSKLFRRLSSSNLGTGLPDESLPRAMKSASEELARLEELTSLHGLRPDQPRDLDDHAKHLRRRMQLAHVVLDAQAGAPPQRLASAGLEALNGKPAPEVKGKGRATSATGSHLTAQVQLIVAAAQRDLGRVADAAGTLTALAGDSKAPLPARAEALLELSWLRMDQLDLIEDLEHDLQLATTLDPNTAGQAAEIRALWLARNGDIQEALSECRSAAIPTERHDLIKARVLAQSGASSEALSILHKSTAQRDRLGTETLLLSASLRLQGADEDGARAMIRLLPRVVAKSRVPRRQAAHRLRIEAETWAALGDGATALAKEERAARLVAAPGAPRAKARVARLALSSLMRARVSGHTNELSRALSLTRLYEARGGPLHELRANIAAALARSNQREAALDQVHLALTETVSDSQRLVLARVALMLDDIPAAGRLLAPLTAKSSLELTLLNARAQLESGAPEVALATLSKMATELDSEPEVVDDLLKHSEAALLEARAQIAMGASTERILLLLDQATDRYGQAGQKRAEGVQEAVRGVESVRERRLRLSSLAVTDPHWLNQLSTMLLPAALEGGINTTDSLDDGERLAKSMVAIIGDDPGLSLLSRNPAPDSPRAPASARTKSLSGGSALAERLLTELLEHHPTSAMAFLVRSWARMRLGQFDAAKADARRARQLAPDACSLISHVALAQAWGSDLDAAFDSWFDACNYGYTGLEMSLTLSLTRAPPKSAAALRADPRYETLLQLAKRLANDNLHQFLSNSAPVDIHSAAAWKELDGYLLLSQQQPIEAKSALEEAFALHQRAGQSVRPALLGALGIASLQLGQRQAAIDNLTQALKLLPLPPRPPILERDWDYTNQLFEGRRLADDPVILASMLAEALGESGQPNSAMDALSRTLTRTLDAFALSREQLDGDDLR